ncbi:unnamed protein product, partial [marine sediment metagenome]
KDGKFEHTDSVSSTNVNYEQYDGKFDVIDNSIIESTDLDYGLRVLQSDLKIKFPLVDTLPILYHGKGISDLSTKFKGIAVLNPATMEYDIITSLNPSPEVHYGESSVVYTEVHPNIDLTYTHIKTAVKQEVSIPESERALLSGNDGDYLVIVSELTADEITLEDGVTRAGDHRILPEVAYFNAHNPESDIPMTAFHKSVDGKTLLLIGIPLEIATDIMANPGTLILDPTDTLSYGSGEQTATRLRSLQSTLALSRGATSATSSINAYAVGFY